MKWYFNKDNVRFIYIYDKVTKYKVPFYQIPQERKITYTSVASNSFQKLVHTIDLCLFLCEHKFIALGRFMKNLKHDMVTEQALECRFC